MYSPVTLTEEASAAGAAESALHARGDSGAAADPTGGAEELSGGGRQPGKGVGEGTTSAASDGEGHRLVATSASGGGDKESTTQNADRETKHQPNSGKSGKRRGRGRTKPKPTRGRKQTGAEKGGGGGCKRKPTRPSSPDSARDKDRGSASSPRSGRGSERERGGSARSRSDSPPGRRRRRRGTGHGGGNDGKDQRDLQTSDGSKAQAVVGAAADHTCGTLHSTGEARAGVVEAEEDGGGPDPTEAENMLQALAGLSNTLRRLSRAEEDTAGRVAGGSTEQLRPPLGGRPEAGKDKGDEERAPGTLGSGEAEEGVLRSIPAVTAT